MSPSLVRYTLTLASAMAVGCATEAPRPAQAPLPGVTSLVEGFVNAEEIRCSWGLAESCSFTGEAYHLGMGVPRDLKRALSYFQRACSLGSTDGCVMSGVITVKRGDRTNSADVLATWEESCGKGSYAGCYAAGATLTFDPHGLGTRRDMPRGRMHLAKACSARYLPACALEAVIVVHLKETSSYAAAREKLEEACTLRERESCHYLAQFELDGTFGPVDERTAGKHFLQACNEGWGAACAALAYMWARGIGTSVNADKAKQLTEVACALKHEPACKVLRDPGEALPPP